MDDPWIAELQRKAHALDWLGSHDCFLAQYGPRAKHRWHLVLRNGAAVVGETALEAIERAMAEED